MKTNNKKGKIMLDRTVIVRIDRNADWAEVQVDGTPTVRCHETELFEKMADAGLLPCIAVDWNATVKGPRL